MSTEPILPFADGPEPIGGFVDPVLVDPTPSLLTAVVEAYRAAAPGVVEPSVQTLRVEASGGDSPAATEAPAATGDRPDRSDALSSSLPALAVLASDRAVDAVTDGFRPASRLAALAETGAVELLTLTEPQPNAALVGRETGSVLVAGGYRDGVDASADSPARWCRVGDDPALRERYVPLVESAEERRLRTPSRRRMHESVRERCGVAVADDVVRAIDPGAVEGDGVAGAADAAIEPDGPDLADARRRAYVVGVRHGALDRDLRRACEEAGLGSSATFTRIKRELREAGLLATESVPQPVGRPRERLVARGALADADGPSEAVAAALDAVE
ncbi:hypothetical protein DJ73_03575 [Halorubrum sp. Ea1]|uniref:transcriptional regulator TbsP domain-containing protein n=1 Tax=Halorubrum sp. Ea1 TaxID=1480718 RepID=UPI000B995610|nr:DUF5821 family protein [Halorubrum sp. Ea1]OYR55178.1 hypothetical protein DJ73_03575 [Halorubrum sp. Ea1]